MANNERFQVRDRRPGYLRVYNDLFDRFGSILGPYGLAVYMALCRYANQDSECWPCYNTIARVTGMSRRQVIRQVVKMEELQVIAVERNGMSANVFLLLDTTDLEVGGGDCESLGGVTVSHPGGDCESPKQDLVNKLRDTRNNRNKVKTDSSTDRKSAYVPAEYADIIHH